ncbi:UvrB/UvrC motif-containing protein [Gottfriedia solisilvae]|uniref:UvrB/UvrC motif-containing protein n=1 Tax=Gottfriedia solisilvae TaxID=1516104 RepID=UPI003D2ECB89
MKDSQGHILYVGKAKSLKKRVQTYFQNTKTHSPKIKKLVAHLKDFDTIQTDTEFDAFMLECHLIKEIKPHYNRMMKSPQSFAYLVIDSHKKVRKIEVSNQLTDIDNSFIFGPFTSRSLVERAINGIKDCFKINCAFSTIKNSACLNYSLGTCNGVCLGGKAVEEYNAIIDRLIGFLNRTDMSLIEEMQQMMHQASEEFNFEAATKYRDWIDTVSLLLKKEKVIEFTEKNHNIIIVERLDDTSIKMFLVKRTQVLFSEIYQMNNKSIDQLIEAIKLNAQAYFLNHELKESYDVSRDEIDEAQIIYSYLNSPNCHSVIIKDQWLKPKNSSTLDKELLKIILAL